MIHVLINEIIFLTLLPPLSPTTFRNVRMEECRKPEWATIQPLTRGTGNHDGAIVSSGISSGGKPIENTCQQWGKAKERFRELWRK